jgi:transmembrane sensor
MKRDLPNIDQKLLVLYLLDEISQQGRQVVEAWLEASDANRIEFEILRKTWDETGKIAAESVAFDTGRAWGKMQERIGTEAKVARPVRQLPLKKRAIRTWVAVAAVLTLGILSIVFTQLLKTGEDAGFTTLASADVVVQDTLNDGSSVVLNTNTQLQIPKSFDRNNRTVKLNGEAFFDVSPDSTRPFVIDAGIGQVTVLGTSFQVKAYSGSDLEVFVESGRVEVSTVDRVTGEVSRLILNAGERGMIHAGSGEIGKPADIGADELFWANRKLIFQETKLSIVFDLLKKHYEADIEVENPTVLNCLLSATFTDESIGQILEVVAASFDLTMTKDQEKYVINGKGCGNEEE